MRTKNSKARCGIVNRTSRPVSEPSAHEHIFRLSPTVRERASFFPVACAISCERVLNLDSIASFTDSTCGHDDERCWRADPRSTLLDQDTGEPYACAPSGYSSAISWDLHAEEAVLSVGWHMPFPRASPCRIRSVRRLDPLEITQQILADLETQTRGAS